MTTISQSQRYLPHGLSTKYYACKLYRSGHSVHFVCRRYKISRASLMRWNKKFDGNKDSLRNTPHTSLSPHSNDHTPKEIKSIRVGVNMSAVIRDNAMILLHYKTFKEDIAIK